VPTEAMRPSQASWQLRQSLMGSLEFAKRMVKEGDYEQASDSLRRALKCSSALQQQRPLFEVASMADALESERGSA